MADRGFKESARKFFVRVWFGLGKEWDSWEPRYELRHGGEEFVCDARASGSRHAGSGPDLIMDLGDVAAEALARGQYWDFMSRASMRGRVSYVRLLEQGLRATPTLAPDMSRLVRPANRPGVVADVIAKIRQEIPAGAARIEAMLRMWSFEDSFETKADRLSDFVVPDVEALPWLEAPALDLTTAALPMLDALVAESRPLADGAIKLPDYHRDEDPWIGEVPVKWGRGTLFKNGRRKEEALASFPAAARLLTDPERLVNLAYLTLAPRARLPRHVDGFPLFASWHLGLHVPPDCGIEVAGQEREHSNGGAIAFDDSFLHSAWNGSDQLRVLLSAWLLHPTFSNVEARALALVLPVLGWGN